MRICWKKSPVLASCNTAWWEPGSTPVRDFYHQTLFQTFSLTFFRPCLLVQFYIISFISSGAFKIMCAGTITWTGTDSHFWVGTLTQDCPSTFFQVYVQLDFPPTDSKLLLTLIICTLTGTGTHFSVGTSWKKVGTCSILLVKSCIKWKICVSP